MTDQELASIVAEHQAEVLRYLWYLGADRSTSEDLAQEVFLAAYRAVRFPDLDEPHACRSWLRRTARNLFLKHCRQLRTRREQVDSAYLEQAEAVWVEEFVRDGDGYDAIEALRRCLDGLPDRQRRLLDLHYGDGLTRQQLAERLSQSVDGVKTALRRVRLELAGCVQRRLRREASA